MTDPAKIHHNIRASGLSIYDDVGVGDPELWYSTDTLQTNLQSRLIGESLAGLPLRSRSKRLKSLVAEAMGYPVPSSFRKTQPRFPGQALDVFGQKALNLQIWNEAVDPDRRYALVHIGDKDQIVAVRVVPGTVLEPFDRTGTLTTKYQARLRDHGTPVKLLSPEDTRNLQRLDIVVREGTRILRGEPTDPPERKSLLRITEVFNRLQSLVGSTFSHLGMLQERNRGYELHQAVCAALGYQLYADTGAFPDIPHQLLEVKLQTSPTIDLGLVRPDSDAALMLPPLDGTHLRHKDVRYAVFQGQVEEDQVRLTGLYLSTGERFFEFFEQFQGKVQNSKIQLRLPADFFGI